MASTFPKNFLPLVNGTFFPLEAGLRRPRQEAQDDEVMKLCLMCDKEGTHQCGRCKALYCSRECQAKDWFMHKLVCEQLEAAQGRRRDGHMLVLLFSQNEKTPRLVWIRDNLDPSERFGEGRFDEVTRLLCRDSFSRPEDAEDQPTCSLTMNPAMPWRKCGRGVDLVTLTLVGPRQTSSVGTVGGQRGNIKINEAILRLSPPGHMRVQYGSAVVWAYHRHGSPVGDTPADDDWPHERGSLTSPRDFTARDFRSAIDFFHSARPNPCVVDPERYPPASYGCEMWPALKINCLEDVKRFAPFMPDGGDLPYMEAVQVPSTSQMAGKFRIAFAELFGLSWVADYCYTNTDLDLNGENEPDYTNEPCPYFRFGCVQDDKYGPHPVPSLDRAYGGSILLMHKKGVPLHPIHLMWFHEVFMTFFTSPVLGPDEEAVGCKPGGLAVGVKEGGRPPVVLKEGLLKAMGAGDKVPIWLAGMLRGLWDDLQDPLRKTYDDLWRRGRVPSPSQLDGLYQDRLPSPYEFEEDDGFGTDSEPADAARGWEQLLLLIDSA